MPSIPGRILDDTPRRARCKGNLDERPREHLKHVRLRQRRNRLVLDDGEVGLVELDDLHRPAQSSSSTTASTTTNRLRNLHRHVRVRTCCFDRNGRFDYPNNR